MYYKFYLWSIPKHVYMNIWVCYREVIIYKTSRLSSNYPTVLMLGFKNLVWFKQIPGIDEILHFLKAYLIYFSSIKMVT